MANLLQGIDHYNRPEKWYYTKDELKRTPSNLHGFDPSKELSLRQQAASFIEEMGLRLKVNQMTINTAVVYMNRFYMHHSFGTYNRYHIATACIFLACKIEEQPHRIGEVINVFNSTKGHNVGNIDQNSSDYITIEERIKTQELFVLQTLGFDVTVDHPHSHLVTGVDMIKIGKELAQISFFMAHNSLLLTTMCLEYKPTTVACVCINLSCRWKGMEIPLSSEKKNWWEYIDSTLDSQRLDQLTFEFLEIIKSCPSRLKKKIDDYCKKRAHSSNSPATDLAGNNARLLNNHTMQNSASKRRKLSCTDGNEQIDGQSQKYPNTSLNFSHNSLNLHKPYIGLANQQQQLSGPTVIQANTKREPYYTNKHPHSRIPPYHSDQHRQDKKKDTTQPPFQPLVPPSQQRPNTNTFNKLAIKEEKRS